MEELILEIKKVLESQQSKHPEPWVDLRKACLMKGIAYGSISQSKFRWRQPRGGTPDGIINNRKYWRPETIREWILQTDEDLLKYKEEEEE